MLSMAGARLIDAGLRDLSPEGRFTTLLFTRIDPRDRSLQYVSAGHTTSYLFDAHGVVKAQLNSTGIPLGIIAYVAFHPVPVVKSHELPYLIIGAGILLVFLGLLEELIFRALLQPYLCSLYGASRGVLITAAMCAVLGSGSRSPVTMLFTFVVALCYGWLVQTNHSIMGVAISHGVIGILTVLVLPNL